MMRSKKQKKMLKILAVAGNLTLLWWVFLLAGCGGPPEPPPKAQLIVKKMPAETKTKPQPQKPPEASVSLAKKASAPPAKPEKLKAKKDLETGKPGKQLLAAVPEKLQQLMVPVPGKTPKEKAPEIADGYDPTGKVDPFESIFKEKPKPTGTDTEKPEEPIRPLTPLEKLDLSQLKIVGIIRAPSGNRALVEEASGKGYIVKKGTYIGLNKGVVSQILDDRIIVRETVKNYYGEKSVRNRELRIQKPPGEL